jgi:hypothetical protein
MLENEDSVVTSLNELRKLKHERITRQTQSRAVVGAGRAAALAVDPASDQMTPPPALVPSLAPAKQAAPFLPVPAPSQNLGFSGAAAPAPLAYHAAPVSSPPVVQVKTSYKAAVFVTVLLVGAAGAGYMKLQNDTQALLSAKDATIKRVEEERLLTAGVAAKADAQARNNLRQCEEKLKATMALVPVTPPAAAPAAAAVEKKPAVASKAAARAAKSKPAARPSRRAQADSAGPKPADVPNIAKKKKLDNDPLAGLGKL